VSIYVYIYVTSKLCLKHKYRTSSTNIAAKYKILVEARVELVSHLAIFCVKFV